VGVADEVGDQVDVVLAAEGAEPALVPDPEGGQLGGEHYRCGYVHGGQGVAGGGVRGLAARLVEAPAAPTEVGGLGGGEHVGPAGAGVAELCLQAFDDN